MEIGTKIYNSTFLPIVVAAPHLRRYVIFGNLFAAAGSDPEIFRIDRHPTMSRHPATPMKEADGRWRVSGSLSCRRRLPRVGPTKH